MVAFSLSQMFGAKISFGESLKWHVIIGLFSGALGGLSSIWSPPVAMYLLARNVSKAEFIGATGFLFLAGSIPLAIGLAFAGVLTIDTILHSLMGLIVVLIGFRIGEWLRGHVQPGIISPDRVMGIFDYGRAAYRRWVVLDLPDLVKHRLNRVKSC